MIKRQSHQINYMRGWIQDEQQKGGIKTKGKLWNVDRSQSKKRQKKGRTNAATTGAKLNKLFPSIFPLVYVSLKI
jgi:hypothetical protein